jgi:hypothetical protein
MANRLLEGSEGSYHRRSVNYSSLPYTVLILMVELAVGSIAVLTVMDVRGEVTRGYVKSGVLTIVPLAILAGWTFAMIRPTDEIDGYLLNADWFNGSRIGVAAFVVVAGAHAFAVLMERRRLGIVLGTLGGVIGGLALVAIGVLIAPPAWSLVGMVVSLLVGAVVLGGALMAMMWGHWYLTSGRLPKEPMEQMALLVFGAVLVQALLVVLAVVIPARVVPLSEGSIGVGLSANPAFWLRVGVGLLFPAGMAWLAWRTARIRGMMSATGLLYLALGALLAGEVLARGLLFTTGQAV